MKLTCLCLLSMAFSASALTLAAESGKAAPAAPAKPVKIVFKMTGKQGAKGTIYFKSAEKMRMEMESDQPQQMMGGMGKKMVTIINGKAVHMLNDEQKTAMKMPEGMNPASRMMQGPLNPANSNGFVKRLEKEGFKKAGTARVGKDNCDVWKGSPKAMGKGKEGATGTGEGTVWVRQSDRLPLKFEMKDPNMTGNGTFDWNAKMDESLFKVPSGYKVTDMAEMMRKMGKGKVPGKSG